MTTRRTFLETAAGGVTAALAGSRLAFASDLTKPPLGLQLYSLRAALAKSCAAADVVLLIAGSSAGRDDHSANVIGTDGMLSAHGIAVKPGHPVVLHSSQ